jgi:cysteinyl-tRNA synthetase
MSLKYLGKVFDIHTGGVDNKFPHHENEICQSSHALDIEKQANYWMHNEHLLVDNKKMSKSLGNFFTLRDLERKGFNPLALREVYLRSHYRQQLNFSLESLKSGESNIRKINDFYTKFKNEKAQNIKDTIKNLYKEKLEEFERYMADDLDTHNALTVIYDFMNQVNKNENYSKEDIKLVLDFMEKTNKILALIEEKEEVPKIIVDLAEKRVNAKIQKNYKLADSLREEINSRGYEIKDSKNSLTGYILNKV